MSGTIVSGSGFDISTTHSPLHSAPSKKKKLKFGKKWRKKQNMESGEETQSVAANSYVPVNDDVKSFNIDSIPWADDDDLDEEVVSVPVVPPSPPPTWTRTTRSSAIAPPPPPPPPSEIEAPTAAEAMASSANRAVDKGGGSGPFDCVMETMCCVHKKMSEPDELTATAITDGSAVLGHHGNDVGTLMTTSNGDLSTTAANILAQDQNKKMISSSSSSLLNRQSAAAAVTSSTTFNSSSSSSSSSSSRVASTSEATSHASSTKFSTQRSQQMTHSRSNELKKFIGGAQRVKNFSHLPLTSPDDSLPASLMSNVGAGDVVPLLNGVSVVNNSLGNAMNSASTVQSSSSSSFEQTSATKVKVVQDGVSREKVEARNLGHQKIQSNDMSFEASHAKAAVKEKLQTNSITAEKMAAVSEGHITMSKGDVTQKEEHKAMATSMKVATENLTAEKTAMASQAERQIINSQGIINQETHRAAQASSKVTFTSSKEVSSSQSHSSSTIMASQMGSGVMHAVDKPNWPSITSGDDLDCLTEGTEMNDVDNTLSKCVGMMSKFVETLRSPEVSEEETGYALGTLGTMIEKAWTVPRHGNHLGSSLANRLRDNGGLDVLINCCSSESSNIQFTSAKVLETCLKINENREFVIENGLENVVSAAINCSSHQRLENKRVGTGILEHLFKGSEATCGRLIKMGGLNAVLQDCRVNDLETARHCARALANAALYGGLDDHISMIKNKVPLWLYPLAYSSDESVKYYACLALAILMTNKEIESNVLGSGPIDHVEPYISGRNPHDFAKGCEKKDIFGQSKEWLKLFVPVLNSKRKEAQSLAAFHFAVEAEIKKTQGKTNIFNEIGAIEPLKKVASSPNAIASKFAAEALRIIGEEVPHKLSQQVPLWTVEDVVEWLKQIGFADYALPFKNSRVDGDLLLQLAEGMLVNDIGMNNGILRKRFMRELGNLKKMTDYASCDNTNLTSFLRSIGPEMCQYTYSLLQAGVDQEVLRYLTEEQLEHDCSVDNSIHRLRILEAIKGNKASTYLEENNNNQLDVFVSYRRSNGSQLASLLKVHLQLRGFSVFIDIERLEAGKFDNNLLQSIRMAKNFILVLTPEALDRCIGDDETKDWVHREIVTAIESQCKIIPIIDNFQFPEPENLPEDMRAVCYFNGVRWIHDYQEACVDKVIRFIRGDTKAADFLKNATIGGSFGTPGTGTPNTNGRHGPVYQRSQSDESKGSDKENNHNNNNLYINNMVNGNETLSS